MRLLVVSSRPYMNPTIGWHITNLYHLQDSTRFKGGGQKSLASRFQAMGWLMFSPSVIVRSGMELWCGTSPSNGGNSVNLKALVGIRNDQLQMEDTLA